MSWSGTLAPKVLISGGGLASGSSILSERHNYNVHSAHYGPQDLLACAHINADGRAIYIFDMNSNQLVQTLSGHRAAVTCIQWRPPPQSHAAHGLFLVSGDDSGTLIHWDVSEGVALSCCRVPCGQCIQVLSYISPHHLLAISSSLASYVFSAYLSGDTPLLAAPLPLPAGEVRISVRFCTSKLSPHGTAAVVLGDRIRVFSRLAPLQERLTPLARDLIYDSEDGTATVVDAFFSESTEEVLYYATRSSVGCYDWSLGTILNEQLLWIRDGAEFLRIFPSSPHSVSSLNGVALPLLYSFGTDQRLTAWYIVRAERFTPVSMDVRGVRLSSKATANVVQSENDSTCFAVLFEDGSLCQWRYIVHSRRWCMVHYYPNAVQRVTCMSSVGCSTQIACGLVSGHVVVMDVLFNTILKRLSLVYSGGTRLAHVCEHKHEYLVWIVSCRAVDEKRHHQVCLLNTHSGEIERELRAPQATAESKPILGVSTDDTYSFLLLVFWDGTFEVWSTTDYRLIHKHGGLGVAYVSWAPDSMRRCVTGLQGSPQLLSVLFSEGTLSFWSVYADGVVVSRDAIQLLRPAAVSVGVVSAPCSDKWLVFVDGTGTAVVLGPRGATLALTPLQEVPENSGGASCIAGPRPRCTTGSVHVSSSNLYGADALAPAEDRPWVSIAFMDGSVGVWNVVSGKRIGYKERQDIGAPASLLLWLGEHLVVLAGDGSLILYDKTLATVNSRVSERALRRPLQNPAFLLPAHRTFLQSSIELVGIAMTTDATAPNTAQTAPPSALVQAIDPACRPCRGPFGQVITHEVTTLQDELTLYQQTMVPPFIAKALDNARARGSFAEVTFWSARLLGQVQKQRFWAQVLRSLRTDITESATARPEVSEPEMGPLLFLCADPYAVSIYDAFHIRRNRLILTEHREKALQANRSHNVDDSLARLLLARQLLSLREPARATDVLMECSNESPRFGLLSTTAVAIAAAGTLVENGTLFSVTTKRAAAMLLASGDVDAAVEKYLLSRDGHEASVALQSKGRWHEAALLCTLSSDSKADQEDVLRRWAEHVLRAGDAMAAARIYVSMGMLTPAIRVLADSTHYTDVAGLFALILANAKPQQSLFAGTAEDAPAGVTLHKEILRSLSDYASLLQSVGFTLGERCVLDRMAALKHSFRE